MGDVLTPPAGARLNEPVAEDRKSTRLNSSHSQISYAVFCLKKKKKQQQHRRASTGPSLTYTKQSIQATIPICPHCLDINVINTIHAAHHRFTSNNVTYTTTK